MQEVETIFRNALIHDGTGGPEFTGEVAVADGFITAVGGPGELSGCLAEADIDLSGLALAPGFIDAHSHDDRAVLDHPEMTAKISQGVTTVVAGNCGISLAPVTFGEAPPPPMNLLGGAGAYEFPTMAAYAAALGRARPAVNVVFLVGHSALRLAVMDDVSRGANAAEIAAMRELLARCLEEGASGFSTGLYYPPNAAADPEEVASVGSVVADMKGLYATHMRDESAQIMESLKESTETAAMARLPLLISHHKCAGAANWGRSRETIEFLDDAAARQPVHVDVYPYTAGSTVLTRKQVRNCDRILVTWSNSHPDAAGRFLSEIAGDWGMSELDAVAMLEPAGAIYFQMHEDDVRRILGFANAIVGSDGLPHDAHPHPRLWGTFPRVIGRYARELRLFSVPTAIHRMTGLAAKVFGLSDRGTIAPGQAADLVVFDQERIIDRATYSEPELMADGIVAVYVNGVLSFDADGARAGAGRLLKGRRSWD